MNADSHRQGHLAFDIPWLQRAHRRHDAQARAHRPRRVVFMRERMAEVHQQPVTQVLCDVAFELRNDLRGSALIDADNGAEIFRIEALG